MSDNKYPDITYSSYLKIEELLNLQKPLSHPLAHDEMLFIIIHQTYELWFKQILFEMNSLLPRLEKGQLLPAFHTLDRVCEIFRVLVQQIDILETMTPVEFNQFRSNLNPASGFQSWQFRELEILCGADIEEYSKFTKIEPEWASRVKNRKTSANLRTAFTSLLAKTGVLKGNSPEDLVTAIRGIYEKPVHDELQNLCEHLIKLDEQLTLWRFRHVQMVERMIGMKKGTGGSLGVSYLQMTLKKRFFPELWEARTTMGPDTY